MMLLTPERERQLSEMAEKRRRSQQEAAKEAGLGDTDSNILMIALTKFVDISTMSVLRLPIHLRVLLMRMFLDEQETVAAAQDRYGDLSPENMKKLNEIAEDKIRYQEERLDQERVLGEEREMVSTSLFMLNVWMLGALDHMPTHVAPLFIKLAPEQFREMTEIYEWKQN